MSKSRRDRRKGRRGRRKRRYEERKKEEEGEKRLSSRKLIYIILIIASVFTGFFIVNSFLRSPPKGLPYKAAIVDHLSFQPKTTNQTFVNVSTAMLNANGFSVDYYKGENVTVNFFRDLPSRGYGLIVLRVHSAIFNLETGTKQTVVLFTAEPFSETEHEDLYNDQQLAQVGFYEGDPTTYFGIPPKFVRNSMRGRFHNTIIIMMGCDGMGDLEMARAFVDKGAKVYIGWDKSVEVTHTDLATTCLLQCLVTKNETIENAVEETNNEVGPDPEHESVLDYYPKEAGNLNIPKIAGILTINPARTISRINDRKSRLDELTAYIAFATRNCASGSLKGKPNALEQTQIFRVKLFFLF